MNLTFIKFSLFFIKFFYFIKFLGSKSIAYHISSQCSSNSNTSVPQFQFRKWLQGSETELKLLKNRINDSRNDLIILQRLQADNQVFFKN